MPKPVCAQACDHACATAINLRSAKEGHNQVDRLHDRMAMPCARALLRLFTKIKRATANLVQWQCAVSKIETLQIATPECFMQHARSLLDGKARRQFCDCSGHHSEVGPRVFRCSTCFRRFATLQCGSHSLHSRLGCRHITVQTVA